MYAKKQGLLRARSPILTTTGQCAHRGAIGSCSGWMVGKPYLGITSGLPVIRPQPGDLESFTKLNECQGYFSSTDAQTTE